jgi:hypothetical protein
MQSMDARDLKLFEAVARLRIAAVALMQHESDASPLCVPRPILADIGFSRDPSIAAVPALPGGLLSVVISKLR